MPDATEQLLENLREDTQYLRDKFDALLPAIEEKIAAAVVGHAATCPGAKPNPGSGGPNANGRMIHISGSPKQFGILIAIILALGAVFFGLNERGRAATVKQAVEKAVEKTDASWFSLIFP